MKIKYLSVITAIFFCASYPDSNCQQKFENVLLIINFNHAYYKNIEFLQKLYAPFFRHIIFYGEEQHPLVRQIKTDKGFYVTELMLEVLRDYPDYQGYLFLEDDCILNMWNCLELDLDKIWLLPGFTWTNTENYNPHFITANLKTGQVSEPWGWSWRLEGTRKAYSQLHPQDLAHMTANVGKDYAIASSADMFYFPGKYREDVMRMCPYFKDVFIEISMPSILACLDHKDRWERVCMWFGVQEKHLKKEWPSAQTCVHPVKLSSEVNRRYVLTVFKKMFPELEKFYAMI